MAKQNSNPLPWDDSMSDGCSGVPDWYPLIGSLKKPCANHDKAYYYGGNRADKNRADQEFREETRDIAKKLKGWRKWVFGPMVYALAEVRFQGVQMFGRKSFNWEGPGMPTKKDSPERA